MAIFKKRGKWWIGYRTTNGHWRREAVGQSHNLAKEVLAKRLVELAQQKHFPERTSNTACFAELADKYWELHGRYLRSRTWRWMFQKIKAEFGAKQASAITTGDIQRYYNEIASRRTKATANRYLTLLRSIFNKTHAWGDFIGINPCSRVKKEREAAHRLRYLTIEEIERLLGSSHPRLYPIILCALLTGMRRGEILDLCWENVDLQRDTIYILQSKSGKPRQLPIPSKLKALFVSLAPMTSGRVFYLPVISLRKYFAKALAKAGIRNFRFHDLRHTFASHFVMQTSDLPSLQSLLGHSSPTMTQRYAHLSRGHLEAKLAAFEAAILIPSDPHIAPPIAPPRKFENYRSQIGDV